MANSISNNKLSYDDIHQVQQRVLSWFDAHKRDLPWRYLSTDVADPYHVWLSEIMLQQTTVTAVKPYFEKFTTKWPTVKDLAHASQDEVLYAWAGLGYYSRARNLLAAAQVVAFDYGGAFPQQQKELKALPGVGDYTSAAIAAIAFKQPIAVVDGNIERIFSRYFAFDMELPKGRKALKALLAPYFEQEDFDRVGDFAQTLMDIGSSVCKPKSPRCLDCPLVKSCQAHAFEKEEQYPVKAVKKKRPSKQGYVYWVENSTGQMLLEKRPDTGILAETTGFICSDWVLKNETPAHVEVLTDFEAMQCSVKHVFTHFDLELHLYKAKRIDSSAPSNRAFWVKPSDTVSAGLPSLFNKVYKAFTEQV